MDFHRWGRPFGSRWIGGGRFVKEDRGSMAEGVFLLFVSEHEREENVANFAIIQIPNDGEFLNFPIGACLSRYHLYGDSKSGC